MLIPERLREKTFLSKQAGSFSGVPQRTVQAWTEKGLLKVPSAGTGDRRRYSVMNCIEIGIIKSLTSERLSLELIADIMSTLHGNTRSEKLGIAVRTWGEIRDELGKPIEDVTVLDYTLARENSCLLVEFYPNGERRHRILIFRKKKVAKDTWAYLASPQNQDFEKLLIINIYKIAQKVVQQMT